MGLCMGVVMLFMNGMLLTSWLFSSLCSALVLLVVSAKYPNILPATTTSEANFSSAVQLLKRTGVLIPSFLIATFALKYLISKLLQVDDDVSIHSEPKRNELKTREKVHYTVCLKG